MFGKFRYCWHSIVVRHDRYSGWIDTDEKWFSHYNYTCTTCGKTFKWKEKY